MSLKENLKLAQERKKELYERGEIERLTPIQRAAKNPTSLRMAINAKCWDCEGGAADSSVQWRIGNCVVPDCPLYPVRPYRSFKGRPTPHGLRLKEGST